MIGEPHAPLATEDHGQGRSRDEGGLPARLTLAWGAAGIGLLLGMAVLRLGSRGIATVAAGLSLAQWLALAALSVLFLYGEGVRTLERRWVPAVMIRLHRASRHPRMAYRVAAPLYAMALVGDHGWGTARAWGGVVAIILAVGMVSALPDPWRGIVDLSVAAALTWGLGALLRAGYRSLRA